MPEQLPDFENILTETPAPGVGVVRLNRPKAMNALNNALMQELHVALQHYDADDRIACMIITGNERAFAAGADIKEMQGQTLAEVYMQGQISDHFNLQYSKPIIAAVSGYALGGGCELSMACDMIVASESAVFGQPEINLGILPGGGGTQRLTRAVGKALAMEIMLTDRRLSADEALRYGLVNKVVAVEAYFNEALKIAEKVAAKSRITIRLTKEAIDKAHETSLQEGLDYEKRNFLMAFATDDKAEGMRAFIEKRAANWQHS
jgi:enoyl-CoA hydratase